MLLKNKTAVISGVSKRFGVAAVNLLYKEGANIAMISRNEELMNKVVEEINQACGNIISIKCDTTNQNDVKKAVSKIIKKYEKIDILLNNAGGKFTKRQKMHEMGTDFWDEVINTNLKTVFLVTKEIIPHMIGGGSIINMSAAGKTLIDSNTAYAAAKSGVVGLTKNLARELREFNIRVNCIKPGVIRNDFYREKFNENNSTIKRRGIPEDIANAVLYFASDKSSWITGQTLVIDGGEELFLNI